MRSPGPWIALAAVLLLANVLWFVWQDGPLWQRSASAPMPAPAAIEDTAAHAFAAAAGASSNAVSTAPPAPQVTPPVPAQGSGTPARETGRGTSAPAASTRPEQAPELLLPVQGIDIADVHDTFDDARGSERQHEALDIMAPAGTPVLAVADGTIEKLFASDRGGLTIYQFEPSGTWSYYYAHLQAYAPGLAEGMEVKRGDVLGTVGSTGNADPAAPHLHFAVFRLTPEKQWWTGAPVNPWPLMQPRAVRR